MNWSTDPNGPSSGTDGVATVGVVAGSGRGPAAGDAVAAAGVNVAAPTARPTRPATTARRVLMVIVT
jgi:hypothetical protein